MKTLLMAIIAAFFISSCAHHHKEAEHHHHKCDKNCKAHHKNEMFDKHCAQSVSEGDLHIKGSADYKLEHGGQVYYFSSEEKLNKFKMNIETNAKAAQDNWRNGRIGR